MRSLLALFCLSSVLSATSPNEALQKLVDGNHLYITETQSDTGSYSLRRQEIHGQQNPFATIVGCSDSRVPPEIIFNQGLGDLFVVRVAGQVVGPVELDSIDYSVKYLGSSLVLVLGHESCGAIHAVLEGKSAEIEAVANLIKPAIGSKKDLTAAIKANVKWVVEHLKKTPYIKKQIQEGKVAVVGGYYHLSDGHVELL